MQINFIIKLFIFTFAGVFIDTFASLRVIGKSQSFCSLPIYGNWELDKLVRHNSKICITALAGTVVQKFVRTKTIRRACPCRANNSRQNAVDRLRWNEGVECTITEIEVNF